MFTTVGLLNPWRFRLPKVSNKLQCKGASVDVALHSKKDGCRLPVLARRWFASSDPRRRWPWTDAGDLGSSSLPAMEGTMVRCRANYVPLTPITFLERAALVYADQLSVVHGSTSYTWRETRDRCIRAASALASLGVSRGDVVAALAHNVPAMYELHFSIPITGGVLCSLNTRHDSAMLSVILKHSGAKVLFVDEHLLEVAKGAFNLLEQSKTVLPLLIVISESSDLTTSGALDYESILRTANPEFPIQWPIDECDPISLNYTSGTTASPKGVVYSHRGAYLNTMATILSNEIGTMPVYLWTVPMFHCNGWCLPWGIAAQGGTNVCLRHFTGKDIFDNIALHKVTHMGGAPTVLRMIVNVPVADRSPLPGRVGIMTGGASPPTHVIESMEAIGFRINHIYGLTETYGPVTLCTWKPEWDALPLEERGRLKSRQGLHHHSMHDVDIKDPVTMKSVPFDGKTMGEVMFRGNAVMNGYFKDLKATQHAFSGGWFHTGDLGVRQPDGYIQLKDRSKDIIISGGENISTIEVESVLFGHPEVIDAAVVARPDDHWGETPCAFVTLKDGANVSHGELIEYCRAKLPHYMAPKTIVFADIPKTSTGKTQKFVLREKAKAMGSLLHKCGSKR